MRSSGSRITALCVAVLLAASSGAQPVTAPARLTLRLRDVPLHRVPFRSLLRFPGALNMHPTLFTVLGYHVSSYMLLIGVGFLFATTMGAVWARHVGQNPDTIVDLGLASVVAGLVGARLLHVLADGYFWDYVHLCTDPSKVDWHVTQTMCASVMWSL